MRKLSGFTLYECLLTLFISSLVLTFSVQGYFHFIPRLKKACCLDTLFHSIQFSRSHAIAKGLPVTLCPTQDGLGCTQNWEAGWMIFVDPGGKGRYSPESELVLYHNVESCQIEFKGSLHKPFITFTPTGESKVAGTFYVTSPLQESVSALTISRVGRTRRSSV